MPDAPARSGARRLFVHGAGCGTPPFDCLAERALVLASADDVVCVPRAVDPEYLGFLSSIGVGPAAANVMVVPARSGIDGSLAERLLRSGGMVEQVATRVSGAEVVIHPAAATPDVVALGQALGLVTGRCVRVHAGAPELTALAENPQHMRERAVALGIPVAPGEVVHLPPFGRRRRDLEPLRAAIERQRRCTGRVTVRGASGVPGSRFLVEPGGDDTDDVVGRIAVRADQRTYLVEVLIEATVRSTVHARVEPGTGRVEVRAVSDRRLGRGMVPTGSRYPTAARSAERMVEWATRLAATLGQEGFGGPVSVDFVEQRAASGEAQATLSGVTPRATEATYALALGERLLAPAFVSGTVPTRMPAFGALRQTLGRLLYDPDQGCGVVPLATGWLDQGRCPIVALGADRQQASELFGRAQALMAPRPVDSPGARPIS